MHPAGSAGVRSDSRLDGGSDSFFHGVRIMTDDRNWPAREWISHPHQEVAH